MDLVINKTVPCIRFDAADKGEEFDDAIKKVKSD